MVRTDLWLGAPITNARRHTASSRSLPYMRNSDSRPWYAQYPISGCGWFGSKCLAIASALTPIDSAQFSNRIGVHSKWAR